MNLLFKSALSLLILVSFEVSLASLPKIGVSTKVSALKSRRAALTSKGVFKKLQRANDLSAKEKYTQALNILNKLMVQTKARPYEYAQTLQSRAFVFSSKGDYKKAISDFEEVIRLGALPYQPTVSSMYTLAQLYGQLGNSKRAMTLLKEWFASVERATPAAYVFYGTMLFEQGKKKQALENVDYAISQSSSPKENWLKFSVAINFELGNFKNAEKSLRILTQMNPKEKQYWRQLAGTYLNLNDYPNALSTFELAYKWGHLKDEKDLINLVSLYLERNIPLKAAQLLDRHMKDGSISKKEKHLKLMAQAFYQAEEVEKSIGPMKKAAEMSDKGELYMQLGQIYLEKEDFKTAANQLSKAIKKGGLKKPGYAHLNLGIALFQSNKVKSAVAPLTKALKHDETEMAAGQWLQFVRKSLAEEETASAEKAKSAVEAPAQM